MNEEELKLFDEVVDEFKLRAKYNLDERDYKTYNMLVKAKEFLSGDIECPIGYRPVVINGKVKIISIT